MDLRAEVDGFDPRIPIERAHTPPVSWYTAPEFDRLDRAAVFRWNWQVACRVEQVAQPGAYVAGRSAGLSWVVARGEDGELWAFANSCRHKATEVCAGAGVATHFTCPYHGWTYHLDGSLRTAPRIAGIEDFDREAMGLPPLAVEVWGPFVLINADPVAEPFGRSVAELTARLDASGWGALRWRTSRTYEVSCNWKAYCDNYLDGGYHIAHLHPTLASQLDLERYATEVFGRYNVQTCPPATTDAARVASGRIDGGALYAWVHPNLMLNRYGPCLDTNLVFPVSASRCVVRFDWWFAPDVDERWIEASLADTDATQQEDMAISERVQAGMESGTWAHGRYAPRVEVAMFHFHRLLAADLRRHLG
jgi:choline monooxygenase